MTWLDWMAELLWELLPSVVTGSKDPSEREGGTLIGSDEEHGFGSIRPDSSDDALLAQRKRD